MSLRTELTSRLGIAYPIIQAPMGGGANTADMVVHVCEAGGLGFIGAAYLTPAQIGEICFKVQQRTSRPFGINLFAPSVPPDIPADPKAALQSLAPYHAELGLSPPKLPAIKTDSYDDQLTAALEGGASVFSFTFGIPPASDIDAIKSRGMFLMGTATTVDEAITLEKAGVDAIVSQGSEAGAHRGTFAGDFESAMVGSMALIPQIADAVGLPVVASGGIMDGRGLVAALALGASAVQMGTAFLTCEEAGVPDVYKEAIMGANEHETRMTRAFSGRPARGIVNRFIREVEQPDHPERILPYPYQNALTRPLRTAAAKEGRPEFLSLWAGQGVRMAKRQSVADLIEQMENQSEEVVRRLAASG